MDKLKMIGGTPLQGEVLIAGAKNAALPILCACLLSKDPIVLRNVPDLQDVRTMLKLLKNMGVQVDFPNPDNRTHLIFGFNEAKFGAKFIVKMRFGDKNRRFF